MWIETPDGNVVNLNHVRVLYAETTGIPEREDAAGQWRLIASFDDSGTYDHVDRVQLYTGNRDALVALARQLAVMSVQYGRIYLKLTGEMVKDLVETHTPYLVIAESIYQTTDTQDEASEEQ